MENEEQLIWEIERKLGGLINSMYSFSQLWIGAVFWDNGDVVLVKPELSHYAMDEGVSSLRWKALVRTLKGEIKLRYSHPSHQVWLACKLIVLEDGSTISR